MVHTSHYKSDTHDFNSLRTSHTQGCEKRTKRERDTSFYSNCFYLLFFFSHAFALNAWGAIPSHIPIDGHAME